jgi:phosphoribosylanthranilate isomerase
MVATKICGITDTTAMRTAIAGGVRFIGFVFYPPSPRAVEPEDAAQLAALAPGDVTRVGLFVDSGDALLERALTAVTLDMIQLHGSETPERCREIRTHWNLPVMKAIKVLTSDDIDAAGAYDGAVDWLMFDARAPKNVKDALPGGNALAFDWTLLAGRKFPVPWMLAGGLNPDNLAEAVRLSGAEVVDVSSGVESAPGRKDPRLIAAFLARAEDA